MHKIQTQKEDTTEIDGISKPLFTRNDASQSIKNGIMCSTFSENSSNLVHIESKVLCRLFLNRTKTKV